MLTNILLSLRPKHWVKNLLIFAPLFFSGQVFSLSLLKTSFLGFLIFSMIVSAGYIINDVFDRNADSQHPIKNRRPIAKGLIKPKNALFIALTLNILGLIFAYFLSIPFFLACLVYTLLMSGYHTLLKHYVLFDIFIVSSGYILRIIAGGFLINIVLSSWLILVTFSLSLFLVVSKRIAEMRNVKPENQRKTLNFYSENMLNNLLTVSTNLTIIAYAIYAFASVNNPVINRSILQISVIPVIFGIFRYLYLVDMNSRGEEPEEELFADFPLLLSVIIWILIMFLAYYVNFPW